MFDQELTHAGLMDLLGAIKGLKNLTHLDLGRNPIGDQGIKALCQFLNGNKTIKEVYLWETGISDEGAKCLENTLLKNRHIEILDLNDNPNVSQQMKNCIASLVKQGASRVPASPRAGPSKVGLSG